MAFKESLFARIAINAASETVQLLVIGLLEEFKTLSEQGKIKPEDYTDAIKSGNHFFAILERLSKNSSKKTDDKIVEMFYTPLKAAAEADGIEI